MQFLLDTHTLIWFFSGNSHLSDTVRILIENTEHQNKDPFDRLLIVQSIVENLPILSKDIAFDAYPVKRIWNK